MKTKPPITQRTKVLRYLRKHRSITPREALADLNVYRLADVIFKLRNDGFNIVTNKKANPETGAQYASYKLQRS